MADKKLASGRSPDWAFMERFEVPDYDDPSRNYLTRLRIIQTPLFGVYLHRYDGPDPRPTLHNHPWPFASFILRGGYRERVAWFNRLGHRCSVNAVVHRAGLRPNVRRLRDFHVIVDLLRTPTWTLLFAGRRRRVWGYLDDDGTWTRFDEHPHAAEFDAAMQKRRELQAIYGTEKETSDG